MNYFLALAALALLLGGCASPASTRYWSVYQVGQSGEVSAGEAERAHQSLAAAGVLADAARYDKPPKLLRSPQPVMSREDTDERVTGEVVVEIHFNERGFVERTVIVRSTKASLAEAVAAVVSQWQIAPLTREGRPATLVARQAFGFKTEW